VTQEELYHALDYVNHSRTKRAEMSALMLEKPQLIKPLMDIAFTVDDPISNRACWILEFTAKENLSYLLPYLDEFTVNLKKVHFDSSVRPMAKICEYLIKAYFSKKNNGHHRTPNESRQPLHETKKALTKTKKALTSTHLERITAACFDWLIGEHKVAAQAYSMTCLLLLGEKFEWIHPELKMILEQNYASGSAAYKARARMTLAKIK